VRLNDPWLGSLYRLSTWHDSLARRVMRSFTKVRESRFYLLHIVIYVLVVLVQWTVIWALVWQLGPRLIVDNTKALASLLQVVPVAIIGLFVLVLGLVLTVAQLVVASFGPRAAFILASDSRLRGLVLRSLLVVLPAVLLAGQVPESGPPSDAVTSGVTLTCFLTLDFMLSAAGQLPGTMHEYTAVQPFASHVATETTEHLELGLMGYVRRSVPVLSDVLSRAVRDGDRDEVAMVLEQLRSVRTVYYGPESARSRSVRPPEPDEVEDAWFDRQLCRAVLRGRQENVRRDRMESDVDAIADELRAAAHELCADCRAESS
jgi:hypothetical protein